jgi:hypothetical protein
MMGGAGGGALPFPTKHPANVIDATTNAIANAIFFMGSPVPADMLTSLQIC